MNDEQIAKHYVRSLRLWIPRLRWFASVYPETDLSEFDERERESFPFEWDNIIGRVERVQALVERGALDPDTLAEFGIIASELTDLLPTMRRLRLRLPDLDALARAAGQPSGLRLHSHPDRQERSAHATSSQRHVPCDRVT
jgi:hypothetical protein